MRIYLPATLDEITRPDDELSPRRAHTVTPALRAAAPDDDEEGLEAIAQLAAAADSLLLLADQPDAPRLRVVVAAELPDDQLSGGSAEHAVVTAVAVLAPVRVREVVCLLVDEPAAAPDVRAALADEADAADRLDERDLLWYDVSEIGWVPRE